VHCVTPHNRVVNNFGQRWRALRQHCGCGRRACDGCALTLRTVFVLESELALIVDLGEGDAAEVAAGRRFVSQTVFASLPIEALQWAAEDLSWVERFRLTVGRYLERLENGGLLDPRSVAEAVALEMAFGAARAEANPDELLPPDVALVLPQLLDDFAWTRAEDAVGLRSSPYRLGDAAARAQPDRCDDRHPARWVERF
jgi:hypothetical protein